MLSVKAITVYPVKGARGIEVKEAALTDTGFAFDREWMIVREDGRFLSQRQVSRMCLIETHLDAAAFMAAPAPGAALVLKAPGMTPLEVPLDGVAEPGVQKSVVCQDWAGVARDEGAAAAAWLAAFMQKPARLVRYVGRRGTGSAAADPARRVCDPEWAPPGTETAFSDRQPYLIASEASLRALNSMMAEPLHMDRFRPNIVVAGGEPWAEDNWAALQIGGIDFGVLMPCDRCKVPTTDQATGRVGQEPIRTLGTFRKGSALGYDALPQWRHNVFFGMFLSTTKRGTLSVGQNVVVVAAHEPGYRPVKLPAAA